MNLKNKLIALFTFFLISCNTSMSYSYSLEQDEIITSMFNNNQIVELRKILDFFDAKVCEITKENDIQKCYSIYFESMSEGVKEGSLNIQINHEEQQKIIDSIDKSLFNEIWNISKNNDERNENTESTIKSLGFSSNQHQTIKPYYLKPNGQYAQFLEKLGKETPLIKNYYNNLIEMGDISAAMIADIIKNSSKLNLNDDKIRLIIAIHYLTLIEYVMEKEQL